MRLSQTAIFLSVICFALSGMDYNLTSEELKECATLHDHQEDLKDGAGIAPSSAQALAHLRPYLPLAVGITKKTLPEEVLELELKKCSVKQLFAVAQSANYLNATNILPSALTALTSQLRSQRKQILKEGSLQDPLPVELRSLVLNDEIAFNARMALLVKKRALQAKEPIPEKSKETGGPVATQANFMASASNTTISLWGLNTGRELDSIQSPHSRNISRLLISRSGKLLISSCPKYITIWKTNPLERINTLEVNLWMPHAIAPSEKGFACSKDSSLRLLDLNGDFVQGFQGHQNYIEDAAFDHTGTHIITGSQDHDVILWSTRTMAGLVARLKGHERSVACVGFNATGDKAFSGSRDNTVRIWDAKIGTSTQTLAHSGAVYSAAFHPQGNVMATKTKGNTHLWDLNAGIKILTLEDHPDSITPSHYRYGKVAFNPTGTILVTDDQFGNPSIYDFSPELYEQMKELYEPMKKLPSEHKLLLEQLYENEITKDESTPIAPSLLNRLPQDLRMIIEARKSK